MLEGSPEGDRSLIGVVVVGRLIRILFGSDVVAHRLVDHDGARRIPLIDRGRVEDALEQRPELTIRLGRPIELAPVEAVSADHGQDAARPVVDRDEGPLGERFLIQVGADRRTLQGLAVSVDRLELRDFDLDQIARSDQLVGWGPSDPPEPFEGA